MNNNVSCWQYNLSQLLIPRCPDVSADLRDESGYFVYRQTDTNTNTIVEGGGDDVIVIKIVIKTHTDSLPLTLEF